jgi:hypothetical protein
MADDSPELMNLHGLPFSVSVWHEQPDAGKTRMRQSEPNQHMQAALFGVSDLHR